MNRLTRTLTLIVLTLTATVGTAFASAMPALAMPVPPQGVSGEVAVVELPPPVDHHAFTGLTGLTVWQVVEVAVCSSLVTLALLMMARWATSHRRHGGLAHPA